MSGFDLQWHQLQEIMDNRGKSADILASSSERTRRDLCSIIEELQKNQRQNMVYQNGDTTPGSDSIIDTPSSIPPPKRRRRVDRLNGTTASLATNIPTIASSDFAPHNNNNNNTSISNNNSSQLKHERLSPGTPDTSSRSLTPSSASHPDTPPAQDMLAGSPLLARNYSDIMRSLAAKYNNANPNDYFSRNGFPPSQLAAQAPPHLSHLTGKPSPHPAMTPYATFSSAHLPPSTSSGSNSSSDLHNAATASPKPQTAKPPNSSGPSIPPGGTDALGSPFSAGAVGGSGVLFPALIDMSSTQALLALVRTAKEAEMERLMKTVKPRTDSPLDLSSAAAGRTAHSGGKSKQPKIVKATSTPAIPIGLNFPGFPSSSPLPFPTTGSTTPILPRPSSSSPQQQPKRTGSASPPRHRDSEEPVDIATWTVDDVCKFVAGIDICAEYEQNFREQSIDGSGLPLLTEEHLVNTMRMRLGPALKLRSLLAKKVGSCTVCLHCNHCHTSSAHGRSTTPTAAGAGAGSLDGGGGRLTVGEHVVAASKGAAFGNCSQDRKVIRRDSSASGGEGLSEGEGKSSVTSPLSN